MRFLLYFMRERMKKRLTFVNRYATINRVKIHFSWLMSVVWTDSDAKFYLYCI